MPQTISHEEAFECVVSTLLLGREDVINRKSYCYHFILSIPRTEQMFGVRNYVLAKPNNDPDLSFPRRRFVQIPLFYQWNRYTISNECSTIGRNARNTFEKIKVDEIEDQETKNFITQRTIKFLFTNGELSDAYDFFKPVISIFSKPYHQTWIRMRTGTGMYYIPYIDAPQRNLLFSKYPDWKTQAVIERRQSESIEY